MLKHKMEDTCKKDTGLLLKQSYESPSLSPEKITLTKRYIVRFELLVDFVSVTYFCFLLSLYNKLGFETALRVT